MGVVGRWVQVRLVASNRVPRPSIIVGHQIPEIKISIHSTNVELLEVCRASGTSNGQFEMIRLAQSLGISIHLTSNRSKQLNVISSLICVLRVLPINVDTVESEVLEKVNAALGEGIASLGCAGRSLEVTAVGPSSNTEKNLEVAVTTLEKVELLHAAV